MKKDEKAQIVNTKTGEIKDGYFIYVAHPKAKIRNERWIMAFQDSLELIATDEDMTGQSFRVLMMLMGNLEFDNYITLKQNVVAEKLKMNKSVVSRSMKLLVDKSIILKVKEGTTTGYKLNPNYGWKGKVENREIAKNKMEENKIIDFQSALESRNESGIKAEDVPY